MKQLNTMESFLNGFKIERNGEVFTLTPEEMSDFRYLEKATTGRDCLEVYKEWADEDEKPIVEEMMNDEEICFNIEDDILETVYQDIGAIESDTISYFIKKQKGGKL